MILNARLVRPSSVRENTAIAGRTSQFIGKRLEHTLNIVLEACSVRRSSTKFIAILLPGLLPVAT